MTGDRPLSWSEIYERLVRCPDRPDARAWAVLGERVRAWTGDADLADETCAEVWRTFNLARGGASFEGFVQGRLVAVTRRNNLDPNAALSHAESGSLNPHSPLPLERGDVGEADSRAAQRLGGGLLACLEELRTRNPDHQRVLVLLYEERATVEEAAEHLGTNSWTVRTLAARARMALARCLERAPRRRGSSAGDDDAPDRPEGRQRRSGHPAGRSVAGTGRQQRGRPRRGGRPR